MAIDYSSVLLINTSGQSNLTKGRIAPHMDGLIAR